jgi:branched-chain amino acid transport system ATP-binding protein
MRRSLQIRDLRVAYGPVVAVAGVSLEVVPHAVRVILGPNGAGKTSLLNGISGVAPRSGGEILLGDVKIHRQAGHRVARLGVIQVPEGRRVVAPLTVEENLLLGRYAARGREDEPGEYGTLESIYELFPRLHDRRTIRSGLLSGGEQQMLAMGRALMGAPEVLLLDEPSMGLAPTLVELVLDCVARIAEAGIGVLMVEQNLAALDIASYGYVLDRGRVVVEGEARSLAADPAVIDAYIGGRAAARRADPVA